MRYFSYIVSMLIIVFLVACRSDTPSPPPPTTSTDTKPVNVEKPRVSAPIFETTFDDLSPFYDGLIASEQKALDQLDGASIYRIDLQILDDLVNLEGKQTVIYTNQETEPLNEVYFRLYPNLMGGKTEIHSTNVNGHDVNPTYELADSAMLVPLSPALQHGEQVTIEIAFSVTVPTESGGNYGMFAFVDETLALAHFYPIIPVYDDEEWNIEIPSQSGDVIYADSSFYIVRVTAPSDLTMVVSGVEHERQTIDNRQQVTYLGGPFRDFYIAANTDYTVVSQKIGATTVNSYAPTKFADGGKRSLEYAVNSLETFNEQFGTYPFTELDIASTPTFALGIEYPGMMVIAVSLYDSTKGYPLQYLESTVAHETAHQWFYNAIGNDQLDEPWVDEAFCQYATLLYWNGRFGKQGADGFRDSLHGRWERVDKAEIPIGMPVRKYVDSEEYGAIVYGRGPLFIEALAEKMGEESFNVFLKDYYQTHKWKIATTESMKQLAESHCDCDLTPLFSKWVYEH